MKTHTERGKGNERQRDRGGKEKEAVFVILVLLVSTAASLEGRETGLITIGDYRRLALCSKTRIARRARAQFSHSYT